MPANEDNNNSVELGAGGGLVGLAVALGCPIEQTLIISDQTPMLELMQRNIELNSLSQKVREEVLDWGEHLPENVPTQPDVLLAADCVYFEPAFPLLMRTLEEMIGDHTVCYFCFKKRRKADMRFVKMMKKAFLVEEVEDSERAVYEREGLFLYALRKKRRS